MPEEESQQESGVEPKPVPVVRGPGGRFQRVKASALPTLSERMAAKDAELAKDSASSALPADADESDEEDSEAEAPAAAGTEAAPAGAPGKPAEPKPRRETIEADKPEFTKERLAFTEWKRKQREGLDADMRARRAQLNQELQAERAKFEEERGQFSPRVEKAERLLKLMETADYEGLAKEAGYDDWEKFQGHVLGTISDPNYRETRAIRRELDERKAKEKADAEAAEAKAKTEREQTETRTRQQQQVQAVAQHKKMLGETMAKSSDPIVAAMSDDPAFVNTVFEIQRQHYDRSEPDPTKATVSPEQAIRMAMRGAPRTLLEELGVLHERLSKALGKATAAAPAEQAAPAATPKAKASKTGVVPASATVEPAAAGKFKGPKDPAWRAYRDKMLAEAADAEEQALLAKRAARGR